MAKISIITLGCKVNQYESNALENKLLSAGFSVCSKLEPADIYIVNTCAVTNEAEKKSRGILTKILKINPDANIYVCGCSSQNDGSKFKLNNNVKVIYGTSNKTEIADFIIKNYKNNEKIEHYEISKTYVEDGLAKGDRTRAVIKIQEGCNNFCSYCLIPYLRGRERSRNIEDVKKEIEFQSKLCKEIIFTGINLSAYGKEFNNGTSLKTIAEIMLNYPNVRYRFSSLEQDIITEEFISFLAKCPNFAPHFHLSLQSGCDRTLKFMNRKYNTETYYSKLEIIRKYFNNPAITTDIIVGFPTETEKDSEETYNFAKKCKFAKIHIFPYSKRTGTLASTMQNFATNVKEREDKLCLLDKTMQNDYIMSCVDNIYSVLIERKFNGYYEGHTENYIKCYIETNEELINNEFYKVKIIKPFNSGAIAEVIK